MIVLDLNHLGVGSVHSCLLLWPPVLLSSIAIAVVKVQVVKQSTMSRFAFGGVFGGASVLVRSLQSFKVMHSYYNSTTKLYLKNRANLNPRKYNI